MTIQEALAFGQRRLASLSDPALDARLLLLHVLQASHSYLVVHSEALLTTSQAEQYYILLERAAKHVPIPYLVGHAPFYGHEFAVTPAVLIPRPETELLVEAAIEWAVGRDSTRVVDVGTGSGCIAIILARHLPMAKIEAVDISAAALEIARHNAREYGLAERIDFHRGRTLQPISASPDLIVANLPYIADHEWTTLDYGVKWYEPEVALQGGSDGLALIRELLEQAASQLASGGAIFLEIGWQQGPAVRQLAHSYFPSAHVKVMSDIGGRDRVVKIEPGVKTTL